MGFVAFQRQVHETVKVMHVHKCKEIKYVLAYSVIFAMIGMYRLALNK